MSERMHTSESHSRMDHAGMGHQADDSQAIETTLEDVTHGPLLLQNVWSRPSFAEGMGVIYMDLTNQGETDDLFAGATSEVAAIIEIHEVLMENDVMQMKMMPHGLPLPASEQVQLKPGGYHIMLFDLQRDLSPGDIYSVTLQFEQSGNVDIPVEVVMP